MSEPQLISPLLDGFVMGDAISYHHGIQCCPAMRLETNGKYIVKIISVPATQSRLDALLLAGAFTDTDSALEYFKELADGVVEEATLLQKLSRFEGFVSYEDWQIVPMEYGTGFDIYLLGSYRPTLEGQIDREELTHLSAVNLGLDLCAALSVARRFGHIYADLQPSNIFVCGDREYRIGDLGFVSLDSLQFASLPDKYRSNYTPPEIDNAYSALNTTIDTYAVGMILYQAYNDGRLPPVGMPLQAPRYADPELSEIILKACALDPKDRWEDPMQMGQALINYLQSNDVNDIPIVPAEPEEDASEDPVSENDDEPTTEEILAEVDEALVAVPLLAVPEEAEAADSAADDVTETSAEEENLSEDVQEVESTEESIEPTASVPELTSDDNEPDEPVDTVPEVTAEADCESVDDAEISSSETNVACEESTEEAEIAVDDPDIVNGSDEDASDDDNDVHEILAQADEIISHQLPNPVIELQPIEIVIAQPDAQDEPEQEESPAAEESSDDSVETVAAETTNEDVEIIEAPSQKTVNKRNRNLIATIVILFVAMALLVGGFLFYKNYYLQVINDIVLSGSEDKLTVTLDTAVTNSKLTVICTDTYGNSMRRSVVDGVASFDGLKPGTTYKLQVRIEGFHKLLGETTETYTTAQQTTIGHLVASTGTEDGSVILSFTVQGPDSNQWIVHYSAEGEVSQSATFSGHMTTLTGLTVGKEYTFTVEPSVELYVSGTESITYVPRKLVVAEKLQILGIKNNTLKVKWAAPADTEVSSWTVRCYNEDGFDQVITTDKLTASFNDVDSSAGYTIEVTADEMTVGARAFLSENSVTVYNIKATAQDNSQLKVKWSFEGTTPTNGWLLLYTVGSSTEQKVVKCSKTSGVISPLIPGEKYSISIQPANGSSVFGGTAKYSAPDAPTFSGYGVNAGNIRFEMCITPKVQNWDRYDVPSRNYTTSFKVGTSASFVMRLTGDYTNSSDEVVTLYVVRDSKGAIVSNATESRTWKSMWYRSYGKLTLPFMPEQPGKYSVSIYFNGTAVTTQNFTVLADDAT